MIGMLNQKVFKSLIKITRKEDETILSCNKKTIKI
jgi:hypothetical protein